MRRRGQVAGAVITGLLAVLPLDMAVAGRWSCRNNDFEISCDKGRCAAQPPGGFTPMGVSLDEAGKLSVCAYSGCWEGRAKVTRRKPFLIFSGHRLKWSGTAASPADFVVVLDLSDRVAVLKGAGFAHPLTCD